MASDDDRPPAIGTDPPPRGGSRPIAWTSDRERQTSSRLRSALIAAAFQYVATGLGVLRGVGTRQAPGWIPSVLGWLPSLTNLGRASLLAFLAEMIRFMGSSRLRQAHLNTGLLCEFLFLYAAWYCTGLFGILPAPSLYYTNNEGLVYKILLLLPFLLATGPLVRSKAWIGVAGAVMFFASVLAMLISNAASWRSVFGFFSGWVA